MGSAFVADPVLVIEREIRSSPHYSTPVKKHLRFVIRDLKRQLPDDIRHRCIGRMAISEYLEIAKLDEQAHVSPGLNGNRSEHSAEYGRRSSNLAKLLRLLKIGTSKGTKKVAQRKDIFDTAPRPRRPSELNAEQLDGESPE